MEIVMMTDNFETDLRDALARCAREVPAQIGERLQQHHYHPRVPPRHLATGLAAAAVLAGVTVATAETITNNSGPSGSAARPTGRGTPSYRLDAESVAYRSHLAIAGS